MKADDSEGFSETMKKEAKKLNESVVFEFVPLSRNPKENRLTHLMQS